MSNSKTLSDIRNGALSSSCVVVVTQPLQVIRTSMMVTYKDGKVSPMYDIFKKIKNEEGFSGFYRGFLPSMIKTVTGSAIYFGSLEKIKELFQRHHIDEKLKQSNKHTFKHDMINFLSSGIARSIQSTLINPLLLIKTRFEVVGCNKYNSILDAFVKIAKEEGFMGYFKGLKQTLIKDVPHSSVFYSLYEFFKRMYKHYLGINLQLQAVLASMSANLILTFLTNPIDVIRARVQYLHISQNSNHNYKGIVSGIARLGKEEGIRGLCAGIIPRFVKKAIGSTVVWTAYETLQFNSRKKREKDEKDSE
jgi:hypothetical protein